MLNNSISEKNTKRGGIREGAGRKKTLPDGSKTTSFILTDEERLAVKRLIREMRSQAAEQRVVNQELIDTLFKTGIQTLRPILLAMMEAYGGKPFSKVGTMAKDIYSMAYKDAVHEYERLHKLNLYDPNKQVR